MSVEPEWYIGMSRNAPTPLPTGTASPYAAGVEWPTVTIGQTYARMSDGTVEEVDRVTVWCAECGHSQWAPGHFRIVGRHAVSVSEIMFSNWGGTCPEPGCLISYGTAWVAGKEYPFAVGN